MSAIAILRETAITRGLTVEQIKARGRSPHLVHARMIAAQRMHNELGMTSGEIAPLLGRSAWSCRYYYSDRMRDHHKRKKLRVYRNFRKSIRKGDWCKTFSAAWGWS